MASIKSRAFALVAIASALVPIAAGAQTLTTLHAFHNKGQYPHAGVVKIGSHLVGTTYFGGPSFDGTVYKIPLAGGTLETMLHGFTGMPDGGLPQSPLLKIGNILYGTTVGGGAYDFGTVFTMNTNGTSYTVLHNFNQADGQDAIRGLIHAGGYFYGITNAGGEFGCGEIFKMDSLGNVTVLYSFAGGTDGAGPESGLTKIGNYLYGTTYFEGAPNQGNGTIFRIKTNGNGFQTLHVFANGTADGQNPFFSDLASFGGSLWGVTLYGGQFGHGTVFRIDPDGSNYSVAHSFGGAPTDAGYPGGPLLPVAADPGRPAVLYGTTATGGAFDDGTVFQIDINGVETMLYSFSNGLDGGIPQTNLINIPDTTGDRHLYGTANEGGQYGKGTVFEFTP